MSLILQPDVVRYGCTCGAFNAISKIYFCRHCLKVRCGYCLCHEVDSHYCANCLENLPSAEARLKKNRCANCYDCPSCFHTLSTRATSTTTPNPNDPTKSITRKCYYLACANCRWSTRDVGIPDQTAASGTWPVRENPHASRIGSLLEYYKIVAMQERIEKERKKLGPRTKNYMSLTERMGISAVSARKRAGLPPLKSPAMKDILSFPNVKAAEASEEVELLPEDIFVKPVEMISLTNMRQRMAAPNAQPSLLSQLIPSHKVLYIKRSQRCRDCEHSLSKPEYNPVSIKFKIQLCGYYHIPEVRLFTCEPLRLGVPSELILKLCNPTQNTTTVHFLPFEGEVGEGVASAEMGGGDGAATATLGGLSLGERAATTFPPVNCSVELPSCGVVLPQRDDAAEYDETADTQNYHDDPKVVVWRKGNKAMIKMRVTPRASIAQDATVGFLLKHTFVNTIASGSPDLKDKSLQEVELVVPVYIKIGKVVGSN